MRQERKLFDERIMRADTRRLCELTSAADMLDVRNLVDLTSRALARLIEVGPWGSVRHPLTPGCERKGDLENVFWRSLSPHNLTELSACMRSSSPCWRGCLKEEQRLVSGMFLLLHVH